MRPALTRLLVLLSLPLASPALAGEMPPCDLGACPCVQEMVAELHGRGWVGIELDHNEDGSLLIKRVVPDSPAEAAGLRAGDVLVALNGIRYARANEKALAEAYETMAPKKTITYTVRREGGERPMAVELGQVPEAVIAQWIGYGVLKQLARQKEEGAAAPPKVAAAKEDGSP